MAKSSSPVEVVGTEKFVESYGAFTTVVNRLQRDFLLLKEDSQRQADLLEEANKSLRDLAIRNRAVTEFLNSILSSVDVAIVAIDSAGRVTHLNSPAEKFFGVTRDAAVGRAYDEIVVPTIARPAGRKATEAPSALTALCQAGESVHANDEEKTILCRDGVARRFITRATPLMDAEGIIFGAVEVFHDISEVRRLEGEMARVEILASIGEMAASVAHQVRNPLVSIKGFAQLIERDLKRTDPNQNRASNILKGAQNLERVIDALLAFSRQETLHRRPTNFNRYVRKIIKSFNAAREGSYPHATAITLTERQPKVFVEIDQLTLREALLNVMRNAAESSTETVSIAVELSADHMTGMARISISDDGPGISPADREKIFTPFYTTKSSGAGLGLALVKKLVAAHEGVISVDSTPGKGATFHIGLPLYRGSADLESEDCDDESDL